MPSGKQRRGSPSRSPSETRKLNKREKQEKRQEKKLEQRLKDDKRLEQERQISDAGKKGAMRAFSDSLTDSDIDTDMDHEESRARELGAAAPAASGDKQYLEREKNEGRELNQKRKTERRRGRE